MTMSLPPSPSTPAMVQMLQWLFDPLDYLERLSLECGDAFTVPVGWDFSPVLFVSQPSDIQKIFTVGQDYVQAGQEAKKFIEPILGPSSLVTLMGKEHTHRKQLLKPQFHKGKVSDYNQSICSITKKIVEEVTPGTQFLTFFLIEKISFQVILDLVLGESEKQHLQEFENRLKNLFAIITELPLSTSWAVFPILQQDWGQWSPWGYFRYLQQQADEWLYSEIAERRKNNHLSQKDILALMVSARDEQGQPLTDGEIRDELLSLLVAGHESTATSISVALYWIYRIPKIHEKLIEELDSLGNDPDPIAIAKLPYLSAVCQETLRIAPVNPITTMRSVVKKFDIMGYELEPGTKVTCCIHLTHQREDLYPNPKAFKPERFLERKFSQYEYLPFGGGNRRCIGEALAMLEMKLVLGTILSCYHLELCDSLPLKMQRRGFLLAPTSGVKMRLLGRR